MGDEEGSYRKFGGSYLGCKVVRYILKSKIKIITKYIPHIIYTKGGHFMCGIVGYVGKKNRAVEVLLGGLKNLEYRGYDSAGIAYLEDDILNITKAVGPIVNLEEKIEKNINSFIGIGHTRWATHGKPSIENSHPHNVEKFTIVHNGIIENYLELKNKLISDGYVFKSDTDTEVACALLNSIYKKENDVIKTIMKFKEVAQGSYAIALMCEDEKENLYVIKNMSPLIIGIGADGNYVASDVPAILEYTNKYIVLDDLEFARISCDEIKIFDKEGRDKPFEIKTFRESVSTNDKQGYEHYMLKEIHEQPEIAKKLLKKYIEEGNIENLPDVSQYENITIVACGSAMHAGLVGKYLIEKHLNVPVIVEIASEFRYKKLFLNEKSLVIAISQSGETADTLAAVKIAKNFGAKTIGIVNVTESSIAREVNAVIYTEAGSEIAVATTKAYFAQSLILAFLSIKNMYKKISVLEIQKIPMIIEKLINQTHKYEDIAKVLYQNEDIFFIGRQIDYALCLEGSLKLKEISYIHSEAYAAGELKHGTISLISENMPVFAIITDKTIAEKTISNIKEVKARGANVVLIIKEDLDFEGDCYDTKVIIPSSCVDFSSILAIIPLQLISYNIALLRDCSIDKPKNLAKSVTVE